MSRRRVESLNGVEARHGSNSAPRVGRFFASPFQKAALIIVTAALERNCKEGRTVGAASSRDVGRWKIPVRSIAAGSRSYTMVETMTTFQKAYDLTCQVR